MNCLRFKFHYQHQVKLYSIIYGTDLKLQNLQKILNNHERVKICINESFDSGLYSMQHDYATRERPIHTFITLFIPWQ